MNSENTKEKFKTQQNRYNIFVGIDPGKNTGTAVWSRKEKRFLLIKTFLIHEAMDYVKSCVMQNPGEVKVIVEDARLRRWYGESAKEKMQGAGSIKRDCVIWEDFLQSIGADYLMVHPIRNSTKLNEKKFNTLTGHSKKTSSHGRDAAMLVYQM